MLPRRNSCFSFYLSEGKKIRGNKESGSDIWGSKIQLRCRHSWLLYNTNHTLLIMTYILVRATYIYSTVYYIDFRSVKFNSDLGIGYWTLKRDVLTYVWIKYNYCAKQVLFESTDEMYGRVLVITLYLMQFHYLKRITL